MITPSAPLVTSRLAASSVTRATPSQSPESSIVANGARSKLSIARRALCSPPSRLSLSRNPTRSARYKRLIYREFNGFSINRLIAQRFYDLLGHLLGVAEQHHRIVAVEQFVVDAGIADPAHRALHEQHGARFLHVEHRHAVERRALVGP